MLSLKISLLLLGLLFVATPVVATEAVIMYLIDATGNVSSAGTITLSDSAYGLVLTPQLHGLTAGQHGFHVHQNPSCAPADKSGRAVAGLAAGGHYDPLKSGKHGTPWGDGHLGDLPVLSVADDGTATVPLLAPRLTVAKVKGRALMIHAGGDNYSDTPKKLGGGGKRMVCGVIE